MSNNSEEKPNDSSFKFTETQDWFSGHKNVWRSIFPLVESKNPRCLEIGTWEGRSSVFILNELCTSGGDLTCIDHFDLMRTEAGRQRHSRVIQNLQLTGKPYRIIKEFSVPGLMQILQEQMSLKSAGFDWIYIDGSHEADDTFLDGELAWRLAKMGAIVIFDDYKWNKEPSESIHHPKRGIDAFLKLHSGQYEVLSGEKSYQVILKKTIEMRIGFMISDPTLDVINYKDINSALEYGMNIAFAVDNNYAMAAAVAVQSILENTPGRITFYIVDLGMTDTDKENIQKFLPPRENVTFQFLLLPSDNISSKAGMGKMWSRIDSFSVLPVEKALLLDADILVRKDISELWTVDLAGHPVAAAPDIGMPMGHEGPDMLGFPAPYFNAGVILADLTLVRKDLKVLLSLSERMKDSRFKDQDTLNVHFHNDWKPLSIGWNAQGLGTYALNDSFERSRLDLSQLKDPSIVHFTGPINPSLVDILNPYVQPYTAKPWGYAGSPGHPYSNEWWTILEKTSWEWWIKSSDRDKYNEKEREASMQGAIQDFQARIRGIELYGVNNSKA